jgi:hypothetical protein
MGYGTRGVPRVGITILMVEEKKIVMDCCLAKCNDVCS